MKASTEKVLIKHITILIKKLNPESVEAYNPEGENYQYKWAHFLGLGCLSPASGYCTSKEECIREATDAVNKAFPSKE